MKKITTILLGCTLSLVSAVSASAADKSSDNAMWNLNGYVDAGWSIATSPNSTGVAGAGTQSFQVRDGAAILKGEFKNTFGLIEVPFGSSLSTYANGAVSPNLGFGAFAVKGQAYVGQKCDCGMFWRLGQFEKIFGVEGNDTKDILFTSQGIIYQNLIPRVHTGFLIGDKFADMFEVKLYVAQTTGTLSADGTTVGGLNASTTNYDFGGAVSAHAGDGSLQLGYRMHKNVALAATEGLFDVVAGYKFAPIMINVGVDLASFPATGSSSAFGILGQVSDQFTDMLSGGVRFEYLSSAGGTSGVNDWQLTVGPQYKATEHMTVKLDYSLNNSTPGTGASSISNNIVAVDGVFAI